MARKEKRVNAKLSRRTFLRNTALGAVALSLPYIVPATAFGAAGRPAPSDRLGVGFVGVGGMGNFHTSDRGQGGLAARRDVQVVALCDVDTEHREKTGAEVEAIYAVRFGKGNYKAVALYNDFRELVARDDIDVVGVATPDHWHVLVSIAAVKAGKDVYCEKPMSHNVTEGKAMVETVRRYGAVFQTGTQQRSMRDFRVCVGLAQSGKLGKIHTIEVGIGDGTRRDPKPGENPPMPVPDGFDYDLWLGPAPWVPYTKGRCHGKFRGNFDYSGGMITDWGAHHYDIAQWGNGTQHTGPVKVEGHGEFPSTGIYNTVTGHYRVTFTYANGAQLIGSDTFFDGIKFIGTDGWAFVNRGAVDAHDRELLKDAPEPDMTWASTYRDNHWSNFLQAVRTRTDPVAPVEVGHRSVTLCHLGNICMRLGRKLAWDPDNERFVNDDEANKLLWRPMRPPWHL